MKLPMNLKYFKSRIEDASFSRLKDFLKSRDFAIITAYRDTDNEGNKLSKKDNIVRNRKLRGVLNEHHMGVYQLIGHWQEAPAGMSYESAKEQNKLIDVVERSYVVVRPNHVPMDEFEDFIKSLMTIDGLTQNAVLFKDNSGARYYYSDGHEVYLGKMSWNKVAQGYSQSVLNKEMPFVFDGVSYPNGVMDRMSMSVDGLSWI